MQIRTDKKHATLLLAMAIVSVAGIMNASAQAPVQGRVVQNTSRQSIEARLRRVEQSSRAALSLLKQIDALRREVQELRNANEQLTNRLELAEQRLERFARGSNTQPANPATSTTAGSASGNGTSAANTHGDDTEAQQQYEAAVEQLMAARYPQATKGFQDFLQSNGGSRYAGKAQYFLAESYYQQGKLRAALSAYQTLLSRHPNDPKVPESGLKIADFLDELGQRKEAINALKAVIKSYPGTSFESMAKQRLSELN